MEILIITGPPYSGKGTQCEILKKLLQYEHISTGDRIRKEKESRTTIGKIMTEYEEKGELVPDEIMRDLIEQVLDENTEKHGIILDGYPRTKSQVNTITELLSSKKLKTRLVINIEVPKDELLKRAKTRSTNSGRKDDKNVEIHFKRIDIFENDTRPAIELMKSRFKVADINGLGTIENITAKIAEVINIRL